MKDLIWGLVITIAMGTYASLICWLVIEKRKNRRRIQEERKVSQARADLAMAVRDRLLGSEPMDPHCWVGEYGHVYDTHCQLPDKEIEIIKHPTGQRERVNTSHHVDS